MWTWNKQMLYLKWINKNKRHHPSWKINPQILTLDSFNKRTICSNETWLHYYYFSTCRGEVHASASGPLTPRVKWNACRVMNNFPFPCSCAALQLQPDLQLLWAVNQNSLYSRRIRSDAGVSVSSCCMWSRGGRPRAGPETRWGRGRRGAKQLVWRPPLRHWCCSCTDGWWDCRENEQTARLSLNAPPTV